MTRLLRFPSSVSRDPRIESWLNGQPAVLSAIARRWFEIMRNCGDDVRELLHDGHPTACVGDAAFGYVSDTRHRRTDLHALARLALSSQSGRTWNAGIRSHPHE